MLWGKINYVGTSYFPMIQLVFGTNEIPCNTIGYLYPMFLNGQATNMVHLPYPLVGSVYLLTAIHCSWTFLSFAFNCISLLENNNSMCMGLNIQGWTSNPQHYIKGWRNIFTTEIKKKYIERNIIRKKQLNQLGRDVLVGEY